MSRICIICPVRKGTPKSVYSHVTDLEKEGHQVFFPTRDIGSTMPEIDICWRMLLKIDIADEVHVWYKGTSQGVHFDMGLLFATLHWHTGQEPPKVKWLNPVENPTGYEAVLKGMCE